MFLSLKKGNGGRKIIMGGEMVLMAFNANFVLLVDTVLF